MNMYLFASAALLASSCWASTLPVVIFHGLNVTCDGSLSKKLQKELPSTYIRCIRLADTDEEEIKTSFFGSMNSQIEKAAKEIESDPELANGFNLIGASQGGLLARAYVERYNDPQVKTLITIGTPNAGIDSVPLGPEIQKTLAGFLGNQSVDSVLQAAYSPLVQQMIIPAQYYRDNARLNEYLASSAFLADINNERPMKNDTYKENLSKLHNFVMYRWTNDTVVAPKNSPWFVQSEYDALEDSPLFREDWLGLKELEDTDRLQFRNVTGMHGEFPDELITELVSILKE